MPGGLTEREGPEATIAVRAWAASMLAKRGFAWQPEVEWDPAQRGCAIRFRSGARVGPADPCFLAAEWLRDPERRLVCERDLVRAASRFVAELPARARRGRPDDQPDRAGGAAMARFVKVAKTGDIGPGESRMVEVEGKKIALFNVEGSFLAIDDTCTHRGGPLSEGEVAGEEVTCPWHGGVFNLRTGAVIGPPPPRGVNAYRVRVEGTDIEVEI